MTASAAHLAAVCPQGLDINGLDLIMAGPDDLATALHGGNWLLAPNLDKSGALIVSQGHTAQQGGMSEARAQPIYFRWVAAGPSRAGCLRRQDHAQLAAEAHGATASG